MDESDGDYSDLTDIDESEDYKPSSSAKKRFTTKSRAKSGKSGAGMGEKGWRLKHVLKPPRTTQYSVQALYDQIHNSDINLEPDYQRDVVWPEAKQIGLIDSVFRNFYIPPVIFTVNVADDGSETRTCIDGKQRLTSLYRFMDGLIPHKDLFTGERYWYKKVSTQTKGTKNKKVLPDKYRRQFAMKQVTCIEYQELSDADEREIFQRVQLGMALTPAEKLQAIISPRAQFIRELQHGYFKEDSGGLSTSSLDWDRSRGADFRCIAQAIHNIDKYTPNMKSSATIIQLEKWLAEDFPLPTPYKKRVTDTLDILVALVNDPQHKPVFKKPTKVAPVEFVLILVLISVWKDRMSLAELGESIAGMRVDVRRHHTDIRTNPKVTKTMFDFIRNLRQGKTSPENVAGKIVPATVAAGISLLGDKGIGKRKREDGNDKMDITESESSSEGPLAANHKRMKASPKATTTAASQPRPSISKKPLASPVKKNSTSSPKLPPSRTSSGPGEIRKAPTPVGAVSTSQPSQPPPQYGMPSKPDRLASMRAARASTSTSQSSPALLPPVSPKTPTMLPSPGLPFAGFKNPPGQPAASGSTPSSQSTQQRQHPPLPLPTPTAPSSSAYTLPSSYPHSQPLPQLPPPQSQARLLAPQLSRLNTHLPSNTVESTLLSSMSRSGGGSGSGASGSAPPASPAIPIPIPIPTGPAALVSQRETERERTERDRREWEIARYGRVQQPREREGNVAGVGVGGAGGAGGEERRFVPDNGWAGRRPGGGGVPDK
ncbi:hypothetical protein AMATHDRAFT_65457 [Amanita thiersii Skay4041]|uniref:GmrSD restriction endonucleases N-terminal domain-containing protein n=1 Tax=Amanita thiersii Skay4041 TaxID=703135 RepID=A0A2A9NJM4_9AGAR|nr:hypothetical protein AMATHDRAFT_65457 [Amanita thiersii Skay4041]